MSGWANRAIKFSDSEKKLFVGKQAHPVAIIKRGEIKDYITEELTEMYGVWQRFHNGFGLPFSAQWGDYPDRFTDILGRFVAAWKEASK